MEIGYAKEWVAVLRILGGIVSGPREVEERLVRYFNTVSAENSMFRIILLGYLSSLLFY